MLTDIRELEALLTRIRTQDGIQAVVVTEASGFLVRLETVYQTRVLSDGKGPTILRALESAWSGLDGTHRSFPAMLTGRVEYLDIPEYLRRR